MSPNPGEGNLKNKSEGIINWEDLVKDLEKILNTASKGGSAFFKETLQPNILKRARVGDIQGVRSLMATAGKVYFTPEEVSKIIGELDAYAEDMGVPDNKEKVVTIRVKTEEEVKKEEKQKIREHKKKHKKENKSTFADAPEKKHVIKAEEATKELKKINLPPGTTNLGDNTATQEPVVETKIKEEVVTPKVETIAEVKKVEPVVSKPEPIIPKKEIVKHEVVAPKKVEVVQPAKLETKTVEKKKTRTPEETTTIRLDRIIQKEKKKILSLLENKKLPIVTHKDPDLDSKVGVFLLQTLGGLKHNEIKYVGKGKSAPEGILVDVGDSTDLLSVEKNKVTFDHHYPNGWVETSSSEIILESMKRLGKVKEIEPWMRELVNFVTEVDNMSYERHDKNWFKESYAKTILGLREAIPVETLAKLFKDGKGPYDVLSDEELKTIKYVNHKGEEKPLIEASKNEAYKVYESIKNAEWHERENTRRGLRSHTNNFGKVLYNNRSIVDEKSGKETRMIPLGPHAAYNMGYDGYVTWHPQKKGYFITAPGRSLVEFWHQLKKRDPKPIRVRAAMILNYPDAERKSDGTKLNQSDFEYITGISVPEKNIALVVEHQVLAIIEKFDRQTIGDYKNKLAFTELAFRKSMLVIQDSRITLAKSLEDTKGATEKTIVARRKLLERKIVVLDEEIKIWSDKLKQLKDLPKDKPNLYGTLVNRENLTVKKSEEKKPIGKKEDKKEELPPIIDLNDEATYNAELAKLTKKDLELVLLDLGWPNEEIEKREIVDLAKIIDNQERYVVPVAPKAPEIIIPSQEDLEKAKREVRQEKLKSLFSEKTELESKLATFNGTEEEYKDLITKHYNTWNMGLYLQNGEVGVAPKALNYAEILAIRIEKKKSEAPQPKVESIDQPLKKLEAKEKTEVFEEQKILYTARELYQRQFRKFSLEDDTYAHDANTTFEKILSEQIPILEKSKYAEYHKEFYEECKQLLIAGEVWIGNRIKNSPKRSPSSFFETPENEIKGLEYSIKEFRQEILETFDLLEAKGLKMKTLANMKDLILETKGDSLTVSVEIEPKLGVSLMGLDSGSLLGTFENTANSIKFSNDLVFEGGGEYHDDLKKYFENIGSALKEHLENKLKTGIEKIQIVDGKLKVILKQVS